ncbi:hypothetical protein [Microbacterium hydrocarbonoxydans]|uniref:hypothetical protein n=1 Tax=Microbacterium hydrocarbonoxydans TaxID=273678 RepID=UPI003D99033E
MIVDTGILLPAEWLQTEWFSVLATFVAINTLIYVVLGVIKIIPKFRVRRSYTGASRRSETRSIHPDAPV